MHWRTFERICERIQARVEEKDAMFCLQVMRMFPRLLKPDG
jgi:hypothetical protein